MIADAEERARLVRESVAEALPRPIDEVQLDDFLMDDLGADSLTLLDIVFRLEMAFDIEITRGEIEKTARGDLSEEEFAPDNIVSAAGLERLRELLPEAADRIHPGLRTAEIYTLFTPRTFLRIVERKLDGSTPTGADLDE
ncbi:MAG: hypothetical protein KC620_11420 [Myxococcales bacterium]|nr:hypothetical protein [Myxococcales bacterium]